MRAISLPLAVRPLREHLAVGFWCARRTRNSIIRTGRAAVRPPIGASGANASAQPHEMPRSEPEPMTKLPRRRFLQLAALAAVPSLPRAARAQAWPSRPITVIVPFAAGGPTDVAARIVSEHMSRTLGQQSSSRTWSAPAAPSARSAPCARRPTATPSRWATWERTRSRSSLYPESRLQARDRFRADRRRRLAAAADRRHEGFSGERSQELSRQLRTNSDKLNIAHTGVGSITHSPACCSMQWSERNRRWCRSTARRRRSTR